MRLQYRALIALAIVSLVAGLFAIVVAPRPAVAVSCKGSTCMNKGPNATGCANTTITNLADINDGIGRYQLRFSATCQAAWARVTVLDGSRYCEDSDHVLGVDYGSQSSSGSFSWKRSLTIDYTCQDIGTGGTEWTNMVPLVPKSTYPRDAARVWDCAGGGNPCGYTPTYTNWHVAPVGGGGGGGSFAPAPPKG